MNRTTGVAIVAILLLALGFLLYYFEGSRWLDFGTRSAHRELAVAPGPSRITASSDSADGRAPAQVEAVIPATPLPAAERSVSVDATQTSAPSLPRLMSAQDLRRVAAFAARMAQGDQRHQAFHDAAVSEALDPAWSPWAQSELTNALQRNFAGLDGLETTEVVCSRSICALTAIAHADAITAGTDWQRAMGRVMDEPWFASQFHDASTAMGSDERGMIYVTYFVRKP